MQFELFEKLRSSNKFQIELEKSYDYFLIIYMKKLPSWRCLNAFYSRLNLIIQRSCLALSTKTCFEELNCLSLINHRRGISFLLSLSKAVIITFETAKLEVVACCFLL